eukprot:TRINITY_DN33611_c0_g1_i1.p1 TRINITY_DN33611_c0_g1~~TRINITY_DN33611_c0_g1_i1.p1  ORF type:complete len:116 (-),score=21.34 TRINITY_DN33611_c0_g1_i1:197-544(-)
MALRLSLLRVMAAGKSAPKPSFGGRPSAAASKQAPPPATQAPPPTAQEAQGYQDAGASQGGGGGFMSQILMVMASMLGMVMAMRLVSSMFGPRRITVVHKDSNGNVIETGSGRSF